MTDKQMTIREALFKGWAGCSNHGCIVHGDREGAHTNGMCNCVVNASRSQLHILQSRLNVIANQELEERE